MKNEDQHRQILEELVLLPLELTQEENELKELLSNSQTIKNQLQNINNKQGKNENEIIPAADIFEISDKLRDREFNVRKSLETEIEYLKKIIFKSTKHGEIISQELGRRLKETLIKVRIRKKQLSSLILDGAKIVKQYKVEYEIKQEQETANKVVRKSEQLAGIAEIDLMLKRYQDLWMYEDELDKKNLVTIEINKLISQKRKIIKENEFDQLESEKRRLLLLRLYISIAFSVIITNLGLYLAMSGGFSALGATLVTFGLVGLGINLSGLVKISI